MRRGCPLPLGRRTLQVAERYQLAPARNVTRVTTDPSASIPTSKEWEVGSMRSDQLQMPRYVRSRPMTRRGALACELATPFASVARAGRHAKGRFGCRAASGRRGFGEHARHRLGGASMMDDMA